MKLHILNNLLAPAVLLLSGFAYSCTEAIEIGKVDEDLYSNVDGVRGYVRDYLTGRSENVIELRSDSYESSLVVGLNKNPEKGVDVILSYDAEYVKTYNALHGTEFGAYPSELLEIENNGNILMAPDDKKSYELGIKVSYSDALENDKTYILPIKAVTKTEGIEITESASHAVYLIKNYHNQSMADKGPGKVKTFLFYEVNDTNPLNSLLLETEDGKLFLDFVVLFAANINYDAASRRCYVNCNENVQFLLDHNDEYIQPLRERGIKVLLGLLGNHDVSGLAQLSELGARDFARELAIICDTYNLDGVNFDDEYSNAPDLSNPLFVSPSTAAAARLCYETKVVMPDKYVTVFDWGRMYGDHTIEGVEPGMFMDIVVANYGSAARPVTGMTKLQCSGMSTELNLSPSGGRESTAQSVKNGGYGYYMMFAPYAGNYKNDAGDATKRTQINSMNNICKGLYGVGLKPVTEFYNQETTVTRPLN